MLIADAVRIELMDGPRDDPNQKALMDWIDQGGNRVRVVETAWGELLQENRNLLQYLPEERRAAFRRRRRIKGAGENAIREMADEVRNTLTGEDTGLVLFEDERVRRMDFGQHVRVMSTWSFAKALERLGVIPSADDLFDGIEATGRTPPRKVFDRPARGRANDFRESYDFS